MNARRDKDVQVVARLERLNPGLCSNRYSSVSQSIPGSQYITDERKKSIWTEHSQRTHGLESSVTVQGFSFNFPLSLI